ncbi:MAG: hypothetical protein ACKV1O_16105 [Saprospiraceae bacterium]
MVNQDLIKRVHAFLHQLLDKSNRDFQVQMVEQVIEAYLQKEQKEKADVFLRNLLTHFDRKTMTDPDALRRIAILTDALDEECDESYSRIRLGK